MPDTGAEAFVPVTGSHTATPQWQSFEVRMRRRRAERCLVRADLAFHAGLLDEARTATEEARELAPDLPAVAEMDQRLAGAGALPDLVLHHLPAAQVVPQFAGAEFLQQVPATEVADYATAANREEKGGGRVFVAATLAVVAVALTIAALLTWREWTRSATAPTAADASLRGDVTLRTEASTEPAPDPVEPNPAAPDPADSVPTSTSGLTEGLPASTTRDARALAALTAAPTRAPSPPAPLPLPGRTAATASTTTAAVRDPRPAISTVGGLPPTLATTPREDPARAPAIEAVPLAAAALPAPGPVPSPEPPAATRPPAVESTAAIDAQAAVRATLARYEAAFSGLNVPAARAVWPAVDERALTRAFDGLASQRIALDRCDVTVAGSTARAMCSGSAQWTPKVGGGQRTQSRRWSFDLSSAAGRWEIVRADTR